MLVILLLCVFAGCKGDRKDGAVAESSAVIPAPSTGFSGQAAYDYAKTQFDFGPRVPGSVAARKAGDWIISQMRARADTVIVQSFNYTTASGKKLPLRNILARFRPDLSERVLYLTHWDSRPIAESAGTEAERKMPTRACWAFPLWTEAAWVLTTATIRTRTGTTLLRG